MIILDSNVWVAFFNKSDSQHQKAKKVLKEITGKITATEYVILEVCSVLLVRAGKQAANKFLEIVFDNDDIEILLSDDGFFEKVINFFQENNNKKLSFVDVSLLCLSKSHQIITFDKELLKELKK